MWGALQKRRRAKELQTYYNAIQIKSSWEKNHPGWNTLISIIQLCLLLVVMFLFQLPKGLYNQETAIRHALEFTPYGLVDLHCDTLTSLCTFPGNLNLATQRATYNDITTINDLFSWLFNTVAVFHQSAYIGNFNQVYSTTLKLKQCNYNIETNPIYSKLLYQTLRSFDSYDVSECNEYDETFFRTDPLHANLSRVFIDLRNNYGWFITKTYSVDVIIKCFNGFTRIWNILHYSFYQSPSGIIIKDKKIDSFPITLTTNPVIVTTLVITYIYILGILITTIREIVFMIRAIRQLQHLQPTAGTQREDTNPLPPRFSMKSAFYVYLRFRILDILVRLLNLIFTLCLLHRLWSYPMTQTFDVRIESEERNHTIPESSTPLSDSAFFLVIGGLAIFFSFMRLIVSLAKIHPDFNVVLKTCIDFMKLASGCIVLFFLLWIAWSLSNYFIFGSVHQVASFFSSCMVNTYRMIFGQSALPYVNNQHESESQALLSAFIRLCFFAVLFPIIVAALIHAYAFRESLRFDESDHAETGDWIQKAIFDACRKRCFFFTPDPIEFSQTKQPSNKTHLEKDRLVQENNETYYLGVPQEDEKTLLLNITQKDLKTASTAVDVTVFWVKRTLILYLCFVLPFIIGVILLITGQSNYSCHAITRSLLLKTPFIDILDVLPPPYVGDAPYLPLRHEAHFDPDIVTVTNVSNIVRLGSIQRFLSDIIIMRLMNSEFYKERHSIPLHNPLIVFFTTSSPYKNQDTFTETMWPSKISDAIEDTTELLDYQEVLGINSSRHARLDETTTHYVLRLYYGDPVTAVRQLQENLIIQEKVLRWTTRQVVIPWVEYNGDARIFVFHQFSTWIHPSGKIDVSLSTASVRESSQHDVYTSNNDVVVDLFVDGSLECFLIAFLIFIIYGVIMLWITCYGKVKFSRIGLGCDFILLITAIGLLMGMSDIFLPTFQPLLRIKEEHDVDAPTPNIHGVPGPSVLYPVIHDITEYLGGVFIPNTRRAFRVINEASRTTDQVTALRRGISVAALIAILRLPIFWIGIPRSQISLLFAVIYLSRWKLFVIATFFILVGLYQIVSTFLCFGHTTPILSSLSNAWMAGWIPMTSRWNLGESETIFGSLPSGISFFQILISFVASMLFITLFVAAILYSMKQSKYQTTEKIETNLYHTYNLKTREHHTFRANSKVLVEWNSIAKALQLRKRREDNEGEFTRDIDGFFIRFKKSKLFEQAPANATEHIQRGILAHNLTRVQQHITDILLIKSKMELVRQDVESVTDAINAVSQTSQGKSEYVKSLEKRLSILQEKCDVLEDSIQFEKIDWTPDIIGAHLEKSEEIRKDQYKGSEIVEKEVEALKRRRAEQRRRRRGNQLYGHSSKAISTQFQPYDKTIIDRRFLPIKEKSTENEGELLHTSLIIKKEEEDYEQYEKQEKLKEHKEYSSEEEWQQARFIDKEQRHQWKSKHR